MRVCLPPAEPIAAEQLMKMRLNGEVDPPLHIVLKIDTDRSEIFRQKSNVRSARSVIRGKIFAICRS
jgi:hypothetical protein